MLLQEGQLALTLAEGEGHVKVVKIIERHSEWLSVNGVEWVVAI